MGHDDTFRNVFGICQATAVERIVRVFDKATPADVEAGACWYDEAGRIADSLGLAGDSGAAVLAALSPRTSWSRNVAGAVALVTQGSEEARRMGCMTQNLKTALAALDKGIAALKGPKTRRFAQNIAGDREAVTVDVWAMRVVGLDETLLGRKGAYDAVEHAFRLAARRRGVDPATMQVTTWIVARGGRSE